MLTPPSNISTPALQTRKYPVGIQTFEIDSDA